MSAAAFLSNTDKCRAVCLFIRDDFAESAAVRTAVTRRSSNWYGWLPDLPDHRDYRYEEIAPKQLRLPGKVDLRHACSPIEDQGSLNSCTGHALGSALEFLEKKAGRKVVNLSRLFVYYNERAIQGTVKHDRGAHLRDGIKSLAHDGVCAEKNWPYRIDEKTYKTKPPPSCYREARIHTIRSYHRLQTVREMQLCLACGYPFVFGFSVYASFEAKRIEKSGVLNMPRRHEQQQGGHAVMAVGYDDEQERFIIRNSWGADWGKGGYFTMPYDYLANRDLSDDFWTIRE